MNRTEWVDACAERLAVQLDLGADQARDLADTLADNEAKDAGSLEPKDWTAPVEAADEEITYWQEGE